MELPEGFDEERTAGKVASFRKALYGLKQSARCWNEEISERFTQMKMERNPLDHCLWYRKDDNGEVLVYPHVDNLAVTGSNIKNFTEEVKSRWNIEDLGPVKWLVGIKLKKPKDGSYKIKQEASISSVVQNFRWKKPKHSLRQSPVESK